LVIKRVSSFRSAAGKEADARGASAPSRIAFSASSNERSAPSAPEMIIIERTMPDSVSFNDSCIGLPRHQLLIVKVWPFDDCSSGLFTVIVPVPAAIPLRKTNRGKQTGTALNAINLAHNSAP